MRKISDEERERQGLMLFHFWDDVLKPALRHFYHRHEQYKFSNPEFVTDPNDNIPRLIISVHLRGCDFPCRPAILSLGKVCAKMNEGEAQEIADFAGHLSRYYMPQLNVRRARSLELSEKDHLLIFEFSVIPT